MSCLMLSELPESEIEALRKQIQKRQKLFLILSFIDQMPATDADLLQRGVTPGAVVAGANYTEQTA